jgi:hypothetical protein
MLQQIKQQDSIGDMDIQKNVQGEDLLTKLFKLMKGRKNLWITLLIRLFAIVIVGVSTLNIVSLKGRYFEFLRGFNNWDGMNYQSICFGGYQMDYLAYPENLKLYPFYPAIPSIYCNVSGFTGLDYMLAALIINTILFVLLSRELLKYLKNEYPGMENEKTVSFLWLGFLVFPFSWFLQLNYTETLFIWLTLMSLNLLKSGKVWQSNLVGFFTGFTRSTAFGIALGNWIIFTKDYFTKVKRKEIEFSPLYYIVNSIGFITYAIGTICLIVFFAIAYGNGNLFFISQREFYKRSITFDFYKLWIEDFFVKGDKWYIFWNKKISLENGNTLTILETWFKTQPINSGLMLHFPLFIILVGSLFLIYKKKFVELIWSWILLLMPAITGETTSFNRYLISSFPIVLAFLELISYNKYLKFIWLLFSIGLWILVGHLFARGFFMG